MMMKNELTLEEILTMATGNESGSSNAHIWIGKFRGAESEFNTLFDLSDFYSAKEGGVVARCGFSKHIDQDGYEEDIFGAYYSNDSLDELLDALPGEEIQKTLKEVCISRNLRDANAIVYYGVVHLEDIHSGVFEGLQYLGVFDAFE